MSIPDDIQLAGEVTWRNHGKAGYDRLARGVYGHLPNTDGMTEHQARRARFDVRIKAVMRVYQGRQIALYGVTALQVLGVALPAQLEDWDRCHVLVPSNSYRPERRSVIAHCVKTIGPIWTTRDGLPVLHPVDHWLQLTGTDNELIEIADGLVRRQHPLITMDGFRRRLDELKGMRQVQRGRRLVKHVMPGTDSLYETRTRLVLAHAGLPAPVVNYRVNSQSGPTYYVDMAYLNEKVAVEYDGAGHVGNTAQMERDARRRRDLQDDGWLIITATARELASPVPFVRSVEKALIMRDNPA